jgi:DNA-binding NarL/FixJ family response regulator
VTRKAAVIARVEAGADNAAAAGRELGCSPQYVRRYRTLLGRSPVPRRRAALDYTVGELVRLGYTDAEIARRLGQDASAVSKRRRRLKLPSPRAATIAARRRRVAELHAAGWSDEAIGRELHIAATSVGGHRRALGLAPHVAFGSQASRELGAAARRASQPKDRP